MATTDEKYTLSINLNVLNHLGINLYSNTPAVLSEAVANAWDADASFVKIDIDNADDVISIRDNGHGMDLEDINKKYLHVGFKKRDEEYAVTPRFNRNVMGRKGIGKLSLFSIANQIEIYSVKNGHKNAFLMEVSEIEKCIKEGKQSYHPKPLDVDLIDFRRGTKIVIKEFKRRLTHTISALRKRLARRFSIIGRKYKFYLMINGEKVSISDRDYFHKVQYLWLYDKDTFNFQNLLSNFDKAEEREFKIDPAGRKIYGWIGTVKDSGSLNDGDENLNKISILARGKLAQEDILSEFAEGGMYSKYLIGEINADFLDTDKEDDIATSSRQDLRRDDSRYIALKSFIRAELKNIQSLWTSNRIEVGKEEAIKIKPINDWYNTLKPDAKKKANKLFGKINRIPLDNDEKREIFKYSILAFENLRYKGSLDEMDKLDPSNLKQFYEIFGSLNDFEATMYYNIIKDRIRVIEVLGNKVDANVKEKILQEHIFKHLWLLDPSWERATDTPYMEKSVRSEFDKIDAGLTDDEKKGRIDIKYKTASGLHVIVELKKADVRIATTKILDQIRKYQKALEKLLEAADRSHEPIETVVVVGQRLTDWDNDKERQKSRNILREFNARVVLYDELIDNAYKQYSEYIKTSQEAGRLFNLIRDLDLVPF